VAGILLAVGFTELLYPELKHRLRGTRSQSTTGVQGSTADSLTARSGPPAIVDGIEGCIGNTPLLRIKSLSDATGCEILGKAEVWLFCLFVYIFKRNPISNAVVVSKRSRSELQGPSSFKHD
jgi:hypothetical protein